jgi:hypothetical protein
MRVSKSTPSICQVINQREVSDDWESAGFFETVFRSKCKVVFVDYYKTGCANQEIQNFDTLASGLKSAAYASRLMFFQIIFIIYSANLIKKCITSNIW